jgi:phosphohistidine phosphatase
MDFFLVRHGEAKSDLEDTRRPLSARGRLDVEKIARAAAAKKLEVSEILHSDKLRAKQTAEILARFLAPAGGVRQIAGLAPEDDPMFVKAELDAADASLMLVGHLPHLGRLAALLVTNDSEREVAHFSPATMICLARGAAAWQLRWTLAP